MSLYDKIKTIAETTSGYTVTVDTTNGANIDLDNMTMPSIVIFLQQNGSYNTNNSHYRDSANVRIALFNKLTQDFKFEESEPLKEQLKADLVTLYHKLKYYFEFKINGNQLNYEIVYDEMDANLLGVLFNDSIIERVGINLACDEFVANLPQPDILTFCEKVTECGTIQQMLSDIAELQQGGGGGGLSCDDLPNCQTIIDLQTGITNNQNSINSHLDDTANPHSTTLEQARSENNQISGNIDANTFQIDNLSNPTSNQQAATKLYVDTAEQDAKNYADLIVQSNIKIIGDWDATSGFYPKNDESNTTPFIAQWGATIKAGWAFRVGYGQAGTVDGFDYENGDVVYALIDNPSFTDSTDWGDLDHNLQQATESVRGTSKILDATEAANENSTEDTKFVTAKKLWANFWQRVLSISWTWAAKQTFTSAPRFNSVSASRYLKTDSSKDLTSVSSIPATDITETTNKRFQTDNQQTYNDATSSIQTQLNNKAILATITDLSGTSNVTGWSSFTTKEIREVVEGNKVTIFFNIDGTSNSATSTFTVSNNASSIVGTFYSAIFITNNGATQTAPGRARILAGGNTVICQLNWQGSSFTSSGQKIVAGTIIYYK